MRKLDLSMIQQAASADLGAAQGDRDQAPWYQLSPEEKIERTHNEVTELLKIHRRLGKLIWAVVLTAAGVLGKNIAEGYRLTAVPPAALPPATGQPTTAQDFVDKPKPPK